MYYNGEKEEKQGKIEERISKPHQHGFLSHNIFGYSQSVHRSNFFPLRVDPLGANSFLLDPLGTSSSFLEYTDWEQVLPF